MRARLIRLADKCVLEKLNVISKSFFPVCTVAYSGVVIHGHEHLFPKAFEILRAAKKHDYFFKYFFEFSRDARTRTTKTTPGPVDSGTRPFYTSARVRRKIVMKTK